MMSFKENSFEDERMTEKARPGRPAKAPGTRVVDCHTVAVQLPPAYWAKLQQIGKITGMHPGRWTTNQVMNLLDQIDLDALADKQPQQEEAFALAEAS